MPPEPTQSWTDRIVIDEKILTGKPVIKGTRLAVEFIIDLLAHGWSEEEILENYPGIVVEDIRACLAYASATLHAEKVYPISHEVKGCATCQMRIFPTIKRR